MKLICFLPIILLAANCSAQKLEISKIAFEAYPCFGICPVFTMTISEDGTAVYDAKMNNKQRGEFKTIIRKGQLDSLKTLIQLSDFFSLNDKYAATMTDMPTYILTIEEKSGRTKTIKDYGPTGPDKLKKIYNLIFSLRDSQFWR